MTSRIKCNLHTHTTYVDGKSTPMEIIAAAKRMGFSVLGFSEHAYNELDMDCCLPRDGGGYFEHINRLKEENRRDDLDIFLGLEIDAYEPRDTSMLDYFIGSIHGVRTENGYFIVDGARSELLKLINIGCGGDVNSAVKAYYQDYCAMAFALKPDILGHFDLITKLNADGAFFDEDSQQYKKTALDALDAVLELGAILEVNTGAMARGYRVTPYPARALLKHALERNARITLTSDAHRAEDIDFAFSEASEMLKELGFCEQTVLTEQGFVATYL